MKPNRVFAIACCALGLVAFSQLLIAGMALAARLEDSQKIRIVEREVEKWVPQPNPAPSISLGIPNIADTNPTIGPTQPSNKIAIEAPSIPEPTQLVTPPIADPRAERLVKEARTARVAGDMGMAIVKLEEALQQSPKEPNALYELGLVHELMGVYDQASIYYEQVFQLGVTGSGELYKAAAAKLRDGFEQPAEMRGKIALGRVRIFNDPKATEGKRVVLSVPVSKAPDQQVQLSDIEISVMFFNKTSNGKIVELELENESWATVSWATLPFDWAGGEETLRVNYLIPKRDNQTNHLFGELDYYGQVVTLSYKGEILDVQAWPRDLAARIGQAPVNTDPSNSFPEFLDRDTLPPNFDPEIPLLNPLSIE
jgi:tetratricopeptide (TPR) repeat protein